MKKLILMSALIGATSIGILSAAPSSAQTVVPIIGGSLNVGYDGWAVINRLGSSTLLTPIGTVSINNNGFNGNLTSTTINGNQIGAVTSSNFFIFDFGFRDGATSTLQFIGTTDRIGPTGAFTNAPTTINSTFTRANFPAGGPYPSFMGATTITGGSITLPTPSSSDYLPISGDLRIAYSTLPSSDKNKPEYPQEYRNDFNSSSFAGGRILGLEDK